MRWDSLALACIALKGGDPIRQLNGTTSRRGAYESAFSQIELQLYVWHARRELARLLSILGYAIDVGRAEFDLFTVT